jgi:pyridoxal phosphate enzyme (YggS family)
MSIIDNFNLIKQNVNSLKTDVVLKKNINIVVVTKTIPSDKFFPLININHFHFGENRVQEAKLKWQNIKKDYKNIKLHLLGKLQSNKVDDAYEIFDFIHSLDSKKLALKIFENEKNFKKQIAIFIQINTGKEQQKAGIAIEDTKDFVNFCKEDLKLNVIGLMCIPPVSSEPTEHFLTLKDLASKCNLVELSMGMSNDYIKAIKNGSTYVRIGSAIFGERTK